MVGCVSKPPASSGEREEGGGLRTLQSDKCRKARGMMREETRGVSRLEGGSDSTLEEEVTRVQEGSAVLVLAQFRVDCRELG